MQAGNKGAFIRFNGNDMVGGRQRRRDPLPPLPFLGRDGMTLCPPCLF